MKRMWAGAMLAVGLSLGLGACADPYGYGGPPYAYGGYPDSYWGWYGDYYYPGTGFYVYDRYRRPLRWTDEQRRYWERRREAYRGRDGFRDNWYGFSQNGYRYDDRAGRAGPPYRDRGYRTRANPAIPTDAIPPADRTRAPERRDPGAPGYRRPPPPNQGAPRPGRPSGDGHGHDRH